MIPHVSITLRILQSTLRYFIFFSLHNGPGIRSASGSPLEMQMRPGEVKDLLRSHSKLVRQILFQYPFHQTMLAVKGHDYTLVSKSELHFGVQNQVTNGETVSGYHVVELGRNSPV